MPRIYEQLFPSEANLSSSNPLVRSRAFFLTFFQSLDFFWGSRPRSATAGFSLRLTCVVSSPALSGPFKPASGASSACFMPGLSGAVRAARISQLLVVLSQSYSHDAFRYRTTGSDFESAGPRRRLSSRRVEVLLYRFCCAAAVAQLIAIRAPRLNAARIRPLQQLLLHCFADAAGGVGLAQNTGDEMAA